LRTSPPGPENRLTIPSIRMAYSYASASIGSFRAAIQAG
jgi:hypothetical protein